MLAGIARFHHAPEEKYQDAILYRGIYSGLKLSCTKRQMGKILPECYSTMFSPDIAATLINNHCTLIELREYMESIPSVATSPTYKVFLFKQLAQLTTWANKYQDTNQPQRHHHRISTKVVRTKSTDHPQFRITLAICPIHKSVIQNGQNIGLSRLTRHQ